MKKINWKLNSSREYARAQVGCIIMHADIAPATKRWSADVSIQEQSGTFREGPMRRSMAEAKEDAVRLARELLLDHYTCLKVEMTNFDLVE